MIDPRGVNPGLMLAGLAPLTSHDVWNKPAGAALRDATTFFEHIALVAGLALAAVLFSGVER